MERVRFYPGSTLLGFLRTDASNKGVSVSRFINDLFDQYYIYQITNHAF